MSLLNGLNEQQRAAVTAAEGPVLVLAGPGSGKTRVLTHRIAYLIQEMGAHAHNLVAVTFTNKAAGEMKARVGNLMGGTMRGLQIGTFHSICARLLRVEYEHTPYSREYVIFDTDDQMTAVSQALAELNVDPKKFPARQMLNQISGAKNELITPREMPRSDYRAEIAARIYERYQNILVDNNAVDFDDLLMQTVVLLRENDSVREKYQQRFDFVLVDEFQDTNTAQYQLVRLLAPPLDNVFVVGDEDQGIYAFRGADWRNVNQFRRDYPQAQVILLEQNYRSTQNILDAARAVIDRNPNRTRKALFTERGGGSKITITEAYSDEFEARFVVDKVEELRKQGFDYGSFAVMYRTNAQSRAIEEACVREGLPYRLIGGIGFYKRAEVRDLLAYLRLINNPNDKVSFARIINVPKRGIGKQSLLDFQQWAANAGITYDDALKMLMRGESTPISGRAARLFAEFGARLDTWRGMVESGDYVALFDYVIEDIGYGLYLREISDDEAQVRERQENIDQLRTLLAQAMEDQISLGEFLAENALVSDADAIQSGDSVITLMTLHAAKGLEFPIVFIIGCEEGLMPHMRAFDEPGGLEEERRLFYVGITRAEDHLFVTHAYRRTTYGSTQLSEPSRFLSDIPVGIVDGVSTRLLNQMGRDSYRQTTTWEMPTQRQMPPREPNPAFRGKITPFPGTQKPPPQFPIGTRVFHSRYGAGIVLNSRGHGDNEEVDVVFEDKQHGIKSFVASFGTLTRIDG